MKMYPEHFAELSRVFIRGVASVARPGETPGEAYAQYRAHLKALYPRTLDIDRATYWHIFNRVVQRHTRYDNARVGGMNGFMGVLYSYLDDRHIETALRLIVARITDRGEHDLWGEEDE